MPTPADFENLLAAAALVDGFSCDFVMRIFLAVGGRGAWGVEERRGVKGFVLGFVWVGVAEGCGFFDSFGCK